MILRKSILLLLLILITIESYTSINIRPQSKLQPEHGTDPYTAYFRKKWGSAPDRG